jgi:hypothetical protein
MRTHTGYPFQKSLNGTPATMFEKVGPFTLKISNHGFYETYEVAVTGGFTILKQGSRPGIEDICCGLRSFAGRLVDGRTPVPYKVFDDYMIKVNEFLVVQKAGESVAQVVKRVTKRKTSKGG